MRKVSDRSIVMIVAAIYGGTCLLAGAGAGWYARKKLADPPEIRDYSYSRGISDAKVVEFYQLDTDVNDDGRPDFLVKTANGEKTIYISSMENSYMTLDQYKEFLQAENERRINKQFADIMERARELDIDRQIKRSK